MNKKTIASSAVVSPDAAEQIDNRPTCFVVMPIADMPGYAPGHFSRVYSYLLKPAIESAGYKPLRADDISKSDVIVASIIKELSRAEMVLCDLSGRNPNVMYELGMRHAFDKPATLITDSITSRAFDIQGLRTCDYSESLRIDSVQEVIPKIAAAIRETAKDTEGLATSVIRFAQIEAATLPTAQKVSADTGLLLKAIEGIGSRLSTLESGNDPKSRITIYKTGSESLQIKKPAGVGSRFDIGALNEWLIKNADSNAPSGDSSESE